MTKKILVTGGAGYIGSHACVELLNSGFEVVVVDNLSNSNKESLRRVEEITGKKLLVYIVDILDKKSLKKIFKENKIYSVMHFAGLKAVGESVEKPLLYYNNNVGGSISLFEVMQEFSVNKIIFSSSATVYGDPKKVPVKEDFLTSATNPYARTKLMIEDILKDVYVSDGKWSIVLLRYFNPIGAHESGEIGEDPRGIPNNLLPYIAQVAVGKREQLLVFGDDYPTSDGTGVRDYIHVVDLVEGHVKALKKMIVPGVYTYNLGTGIGYSVLDVIRAFEKASGKRISYKFVERRPGDVAVNFADPSLAAKELGWKAKRDLNKMCEDSWRWQSKNPNGYNL